MAASNPLPPLEAEWLEPDGFGGFTSGTVRGTRDRRYHALLTAALTPPTGRLVLVAGLDAWIETAEGACAGWLTSQRYRPDVLTGSPSSLVAFAPFPWPSWTIRVTPALTIRSELFVARPAGAVVVRWRVVAGNPAGLRLMVRPLLAPRELHALHHENPAFRFDAVEKPGLVSWAPYPTLPAISCRHTGTYRADPVWYRGFQLDSERARGFDYLEDAGSPGRLELDLAAGSATVIFQRDQDASPAESAADAARRFERSERLRRGRLADPWSRAADAYLVRRGIGRTIIAGYPWFTDWGRDTFVALRGLALGTGRLEDARSILLRWADTVSEGMVPNRFVDRDDRPEYNAVDASLWFAIVVREYLEQAASRGARVTRAQRNRLEAAVHAILDRYASGTRFGIRAEPDGLLAAGEPGLQLTWMDARIGDRPVTPRIGKPVEVQALWINALRSWADRDDRWLDLAERATAAFGARFWNPARGCLYDVVDVDGQAGNLDASLRPNQIFAVGGLPHQVLTGPRAAQVVAVVENELLTPIGLRSLAPSEPGFVSRYEGGPAERDGAYHQGTAWPWLLGAFVDAWLRVHGDTAINRATARHRFFEPLVASRDRSGLGHLSEIADGTAPFTPRGCPFQAWSVGEAIRIDRMTAPPGDQPAEGAE